MLAVVLVVILLGIGLGVSPVREGSLVVPVLDIEYVGWVLEVAVEDVRVFIGFGVSSTVGFTLISWVVMNWVVAADTSVVTFEVPLLSIGFGVSSIRFDPWSVPSVDIVDCIIPVLVDNQDAVLEVSIEGIGFGVSPV